MRTPPPHVVPPIVALAVTAGAIAWMRERLARRAAERVSAALFESLLNAIDANDEDTGRHVRRVASYALALAEAAGLSDAEARDVERVALFHDIGKIHAALFDIIHEGHRLSREDREAIATHPQRGADVLRPLAPFYPEVADGVLAHHERWDGEGYPRRLSGADIPLAARIVAIADTFDAITHSRRYSSEKSLGEALDAIRKGRGTQFDPALVDLFLARRVQRTLHLPVRDRRPGREDRRRGVEPMAPDVAFRWRTQALEEDAARPAREDREKTRATTSPTLTRGTTRQGASRPAARPDAAKGDAAKADASKRRGRSAGGDARAPSLPIDGAGSALEGHP